MDNEVSTEVAVQVQILNTELGGKSLDILGIEIQEYDNLAGKCFEEVCKRYWYIKNVTFKDDAEGWRTWRDSQNRSKQYINKCVQIYQQHLNSQSGNPGFHLGYRKSSQLVSLESVIVEEVLNNKHEINGKEKTVEEMTVKELEKVIEEEKKKYQQKLEQEREAKETVIKNNEKLQERIQDINERRENDIKSARDEGIKIGRDSKIDEEKEKLQEYYKEQCDREVSKLTNELKRSYQDRITKLGNELESVEEELSHYKDVVYKDKEVNRELQRLTEQSERLKRKIDELEYWGTLESNLDLAIAQATSLITGDISTNEEDNEVLILSVSRIVNRLRKLTKLLEDNFEIVGERTVYQDENSEIIDVEGI